MTYVIAAPCVACGACLDICPVDCIAPDPAGDLYSGEAEQMYINPDACVDCGACVDICPVIAIFQDGALPVKWRQYAQINRDYFNEVVK